MFSIEQVKVFVASAELGSFSAAARSMGKSHSSISMAITSLEDGLGVQLFDRSTKMPTLTEDGERFYEQSLLLLRQIERMHASAKSSLNKVEKKLHIGLGEMVPFALIESLLEKTAEKYAHTKLGVFRGEYALLIEKLQRGELDIVVSTNAETAPRAVDFYAILEMEFVCICSPDSSLADMPVVDNERLLATRQLACVDMLNNPVLKAYASVSPEIWEMTDQDDMIKLVEQGVGWATVPKMLAEERIAIGTLKIFRPEFSHTKQTILIDMLVSSSRERGPVQQFLMKELQSLAK
ncbi:transcriptional regulator LysR family [Vibrio maritimus]|uniref:Transcriptional regulator LysR family n=1 Tax=Vibrio maritimus TaxID=990268 RepID=A0A090RUA8_9VIBR|nr:transcriptional regulator LysR family [Vibrio maritimus]